MLVTLVLYGVLIILEPDQYWHGYGVWTDFTRVKWVIGPFLIVMGIYYFLAGKKIKKKEIKLGKERKNLICPKCKRTYPIEKKNPIEQCPKCNLNLLTLDEFLKHIE